MFDATKDNVGRDMAILYIEQKPVVRQVERDGEMVTERTTTEEKRLISVANIKAPLGFQFRITGLGLREAQDLALLLRAGALAAPMYIVEERTVGASLGDENIRRGWQSVGIGFALVLVFMLVLLPLVRACSQHRVDLEPDADGGHHECAGRDPDAAGYRRHCAHRGHGGGRQRADFLPYP